MRACERYIISKEMEFMGSFENGSFTWLRFAGSDIPKRKKRIYRALRSADGKSVIIKALNAETMTTSDTARLLHEYDVAKHLPIKGIVKPLSQEQTGEP